MLSRQQSSPEFQGLLLPKPRGLPFLRSPRRSRLEVKRRTKHQPKSSPKPAPSPTKTLQYPHTLQHRAAQAPIAVDRRHQPCQIPLPGIQVHRNHSGVHLVFQRFLGRVLLVRKASLMPVCYPTRSWLYKGLKSQNLHRHRHHRLLPMPLLPVPLSPSLEDNHQGSMIKTSREGRL